MRRLLLDLVYLGGHVGFVEQGMRVSFARNVVGVGRVLFKAHSIHGWLGGRCARFPVLASHFAREKEVSGRDGAVVGERVLGRCHIPNYVYVAYGDVHGY